MSRIAMSAGQPDTPVARLVPDWLSVWDLAALVGPREARRALDLADRATPWRGSMLGVRHGADGPQVRMDTLPDDLLDTWLARHQPPPTAASTSAPDCDPDAIGDLRADPASDTGRRHAQALWRLSVLRPALVFPRGDSRRAAALADLATRGHLTPAGDTRMLGLSTLRNWLRAYESGGLAGLQRKPRKDRDGRRQAITRDWDQAMRGLLTDDQVATIDATLTTYVRSLWRSGITGWRECADLGATRLVELTRDALAAAGHALPAAALADLCAVDRPASLRRRVEAERRYALVAKAEGDAKGYHDVNLPRIRRTRAGLRPLDIVVGDVSPIDVYLTRPDDGRPATARAISWLDLATNRLWVSLYLPPKGRGVTRLEVAASFASMAGQWGLPQRLYLDNGSEYSWAEMLQAFSELSRLSQRCQVLLRTDAPPEHADLMADAIIRARPYNAAAKPIEGIFSALNVVVGMLPGYVGQDRMKKKSANLGQAPTPYPGTPTDFLDAFAIALNHYHNKPQKGSLGGLSPRAVYAQHVAAGWQATAVAPETLLLAFADEEPRIVHQGHIRWTTHRASEPTFYTHPALWALPDAERRVSVRVARHDPRFAFVFRGRRLLCVATPDTAYSPTDQAGAADAAARAGVLRRCVAQLRHDCDLLDLVAEMQRSDSHKLAPIPTPFGPRIEPSAEVAAMVAALEDASRAALDAAARRADPAQLSQWAGDTTDPLLAAVDWDDPA